MRVTTVALAVTLFVGCSKSGGSPTSPGGGNAGNHHPTLNANTTTAHLAYAGTATITATGTDVDGDQLTYAYTASGGTVAASGPTATTATFTAANRWGPATVTVTVSDGKGGSAQAMVSMYVRNPSPPTFTIAKAGTQYCDYGIPTPGVDCFEVRLTTPESVILTEFSIDANYVASCTDHQWSYGDVAVGAGQSFVLLQPGSITTCG